MKPETVSRILVVRTDRIGDVLLTTPVSTALRQAFPQAKISWLVRPYAAPLLEHNPDVDQVLLDKGQSTRDLATMLKREQFDAAIVALPRWRIAWALWRAGVPVRIGPASKLYSILFTHRLYQHRSEGKKHEADYNLELLAPLGVSFQRHPTRFALTDCRAAGRPEDPGIPSPLLFQTGRGAASGFRRLLRALAARAFHGAGRQAPGRRMRRRGHGRARRRLSVHHD